MKYEKLILEDLTPHIPELDELVAGEGNARPCRIWDIDEQPLE